MRRIRPTTLRLVAALAVGIGATAHMSSWGQTPATNTQTRTFDIPSGALRDTLSVIQAVTGQRVSYSDTLVQGRESRAVKGQLSLKEALEMALEGTGISVSLNADGSVTLAASTGLALQSVEIRGSRVSHLAATNRTGTRTDVDPMELPQSVTTVDKGLLSQQQIRDVREAMSGVSGTGTATSGEASGGTIVTVRGFAASLMRNGFVVPSGTYFNPPLIALERIEVVKGPEAVVAGTTAYGGVVNVITKAPTDRPVTEGLVSFGDHGYFELGADLARPLSEDKTLLGRIIVSKSGEGRSDQDYAGDRREYVSPALTWTNRSTGTDVTLSYEWQKNHVKPGRQIPFSPDEPYFTGRLVHMGPRDVGIDSKEEVVSLSVDQRIATGWTAGVKLARDDRHDVGIANPSFVYSWLGYDYPTVLSQVSEQDNKSLSKTAKLELRGRFDTGEIEHTLLAAFDWVSQKYLFGARRSQLWATNVDTGETTDITSSAAAATLGIPEVTPFVFDIRTKETGAALVDHLTWGDWNAILGIRRVKFVSQQTGVDTKTSDKTLPNVGLVYRISPVFSLYGNWSQGMLPNGGVTFDNKALPPESSTQGELGFKSLLMNKRLAFTGAVYSVRQRNVAVLDPDHPPDPLTRQIVIPGAKVKGLDLDLSGALTSRLEARFNYGYVNKRADTEDGLGIPFSRHNFNLWSSYRFANQGEPGMWLGGGYNWRSRVLGTASYVLAPPPAQGRVDVAMGYDAAGWSMTAGVKNVTNKTLYTSDTDGSFSGSIEQPRSFSVTLKMTY